MSVQRRENDVEVKFNLDRVFESHAGSHTAQFHGCKIKQAHNIEDATVSKHSTPNHVTASRLVTTEAIQEGRCIVARRSRVATGAEIGARLDILARCRQ